jgi:hypothetical protein
MVNERDIGPEATPAEVPAAPVKKTASPIPTATPEPRGAPSNGLTKTEPHAEVPGLPPAPDIPTKTTKAGRPKKAKTAKTTPKKKKKADAKGKAKKAKR